MEKKKVGKYLLRFEQNILNRANPLVSVTAP